MITAEALHRALTRAGLGPFTGVADPCLEPLVGYLRQHHPGTYLAAAEGEAVAIAAGARLAGHTPVVLLPGSGLGTAADALTSLGRTLRIPVPLLVGEPMARSTRDLLDLLEIPNRPLPEDGRQLGARVRAAGDHLRTTGRPFAFLVRPGTLAPSPPARPVGTADLMRRRDAIEQVVAAAPESAAIIAAGAVGRELAAGWDRPGNLYLTGPPGRVAGVALGVAVHAPDRRVLVLDGPGAALPPLVGVGAHRPPNLQHVVLDDPTHPGVDLAAVALACGYHWAAEVDDAAVLRKTVATGSPGPGLVRVFVRTSAQDPEPSETGEAEAAEAAARFAAALTTEAPGA